VDPGRVRSPYQPQVDPRTGKVQGAGALARWRHPTRGMISPGEFIPIAEEIGLIGEIGSWILRVACFEASAWQHDITVAVNLSAVQLRDMSLTLIVSSALEASGLPASRLELEITETVSTLSDCMVAQIRRPSILDIVAERPALTRALWWTMLVDEAVLREWVTNLGARRAELRIAHLFCEIHARLQAVGLVDDDVFTLPITQQELGDTVGLSLVHVSRSLKLLRDRGLASFQNHRIEIPDIRCMREFADFDANYLHLSRASDPNLRRS
jgi:CRP-like cAMP-binding protein